MAKQSSDTSSKDGVVSPSQLSLAGLGPVFLAAVPLVNVMTKPGGYVEKAIEALVKSISLVGTAGASSTVATTRVIPALSAFYIFVTFGATGAAAVAGKASSSSKGLDNNYPRPQMANLAGLPLRLQSAHNNMMEMFPGFALAAALAMSIAPNNQHIINLLGMHVIAKVFLYYPSYLMNIAPVRSIAHFLATGSVIAVCWKFVNGA